MRRMKASLFWIAVVLMAVAGPVQAAGISFSDDFEDDTIGALPKIGWANVGSGYSAEAGQMQVLANPDANAGSGNVSAQVLGYDGSNAVLINHILGQFAGTRDIDGMVVAYDFYMTSAGTNTNDSARSAIADAAGVTDVWMRNDRDREVRVDGTVQSVQNYGAGVWQRWTAVFSQTGVGTYDLAWTITNLETYESINGTQAVTTTFDVAGGLMLEVFEGQSPTTNVMSGYIDNVMVSSDPVTLPNTPGPAAGASGIGTYYGGSTVDVTLSWNTAADPANTTVPNPNITKHYLYLRATDPNFVGVTPIEIPAGSPTQPTASYGPTPLAMDTTYYWRIEESINGSPASDANNIDGPVWSFKTMNSSPMITTQPADLLVGSGSSASFKVEVTSFSLEVYQWFKTPDATSGTPADDTAVGSNSNTLSFASVLMADEGYYYCKITNDGGDAGAVYTSVVRLGVKRKVAHWTFDTVDYVGGRYLDLSVEGHHADPNLPPDAAQFINGADPTETGQGLDLAIQPLAAGDSGAWDPTEYTDELTISAWCNWAGDNGLWQGIVSKKTQGIGEAWFLEVTDGDPTVSGQINFYGPGITALNTPMPATNQWVHIAVTASPVTGKHLYVNGVEMDSAGNAVLSKTPAHIYVGANNRDQATGELISTFNGVLDDIRIYNYALTQTEVIDQLYYHVLETPACISLDTEALVFDVTGDCVVDLADFAEFAGDWLNNNLCPGQGCP